MCVVLVNMYFSRRALKLKDERIKEITKEKTKLQETLLNRQLNSTKEGD
ncbi:hypothetical protein BH09BAC5_BH09BAC5_23880 [soil metagenome]